MGSSIDAFLKEEGVFEETRAQAVKEVVAWQLAEAMKQKNISRSKMATLLKTSRNQVDRLLDPENDITLGSLQRAAAMVGRRVNVELAYGCWCISRGAVTHAPRRVSPASAQPARSPRPSSYTILRRTVCEHLTRWHFSNSWR